MFDRRPILRAGHHGARSAEGGAGLSRPARGIGVPHAFIAAAAISLVAQAGALLEASADEHPLEGAIWRALPSDAPRAGHVGLLDPAAERYVAIGGETTPFEAPEADRQLSSLLDASPEWSDLAAAGDVPASRLAGRGVLEARAAVDPGEALALMVCDCEGSDTFQLDLTANRWSALPGDGSRALVGGIVAYDTPRDRVLVLGGDLRGFERTDVAWAYDLSDARSGWAELAALPFKLAFQAYDVDPVSGHLLAFGGQDEDGAAVGALWRFDAEAVDPESSWWNANEAPGVPGAPAPGPRVGASLRFLGDSGYAVLYGGYSPELGPLGDLWLLDYRDADPYWALIDAAAPPGARSSPAMVWDDERRDVLIHGGLGPDGASFLGDVWLLDLDPDPDLDPTPTPTPTFTPTPSATATESPGPTPSTPGTGQGGDVYLPLLLRDYDLP